MDASINHPIENIAFYRFVDLVDVDVFSQSLEKEARNLKLKGTVLLAHEGINGMLAGPHEQVQLFTTWLNKDSRFSELVIKRSTSKKIPFKRLLVKVKDEVLTLRGAKVDPITQSAPYVTPQLLSEKLKKGEDLTLIDIRNSFEYDYGHFKNAINPKTKSFSDFVEFVNKLELDKNKPIVTYCTGGIRCEKGALLLLQAGFKNVHQLEGGILSYLEQTDGQHFDGTCFVFDEREALTRELKPIQSEM